jgi:hypothetical protein
MKVGQGTYVEDDIDTPDERQERLPVGRLLRYAAVGVGIAFSVQLLAIPAAADVQSLSQL